MGIGNWELGIFISLLETPRKAIHSQSKFGRKHSLIPQINLSISDNNLVAKLHFLYF